MVINKPYNTKKYKEICKRNLYGFVLSLCRAKTRPMKRMRENQFEGQALSAGSGAHAARRGSAACIEWIIFHNYSAYFLGIS